MQPRFNYYGNPVGEKFQKYLNRPPAPPSPPCRPRPRSCA